MKIQKFREMTVAGQFYPNNPVRLTSDIENYLSSFKQEMKPPRDARAIIVPHAGYAYSGGTAARTYRTVSDFKYSRIVIIAPSHYVGFHGLALPEYEKARSPFGDIDLDIEGIQSLKADCINYSSEAHVHEHSLEVQLPLIKYFFEGTPVIPLVCGRVSNQNVSKVINELMKLYDDRTLWVISSDFTHYGNSFGYLPFTKNIEMNLKKLDHGAIERIISIDPAGFVKYVMDTGATICGSAPIALMLDILRRKVDSGVKIEAELIEYTNSGLMTGDFTHCVSYAGIVFF